MFYKSAYHHAKHITTSNLTPDIKHHHHHPSRHQVHWIIPVNMHIWWYINREKSSTISDKQMSTDEQMKTNKTKNNSRTCVQRKLRTTGFKTRSRNQKSSSPKHQ